MKKLILMRHATYQRSGADSDYGYKLSSVGKKEAKQAATLMRECGFEPDLILSSSAKRASQTAGLLADYFSLSKKRIIEDKSLYLSAPETLLDAVKALPDTFSRVIVVAHNPGVSVLIRNLSQAQSIGSLPPSGFGIFDFEGVNWHRFEGDFINLNTVCHT